MAENEKSTSPKWMRWVGLGLSALAGLGLIASGAMKLSRSPEVMKGFVEHFGYSAGVITPIAVVELLCAILYLVPQTSVLGAVLVTGYLGGAVATHVRVGEAFLSPVVLGVLAWLGLFLREERLRALLPLRKNA
jgi:hypothetical protein